MAATNASIRLQKSGRRPAARIASSTLWRVHSRAARAGTRGACEPRRHVLSKALRYADDVELINRKIGLFKVERPEIEAWDLEQYARILVAAKKEGPVVYAATCLAGEAGLRVGEVKGLRWREDVDMVAKTITVNQQMRRGVTGTPKGRMRRTIPMTPTLYEALRVLEVIGRFQTS